jgi:hypothetical protein
MHCAVRGGSALGLVHVGAGLDAALAMNVTMRRGCASSRIEDVTAILDALRLMRVTA